MNTKIKVVVLFLVIFCIGLVIGIFVGIPVEKKEPIINTELALSIINPIISNTNTYLEGIDKSNPDFENANKIIEESNKITKSIAEKETDGNLKNNVLSVIIKYNRLHSVDNSILEPIDYNIVNQWLAE